MVMNWWIWSQDEIDSETEVFFVWIFLWPAWYDEPVLSRNFWMVQWNEIVSDVLIHKYQKLHFNGNSIEENFLSKVWEEIRTRAAHAWYRRILSPVWILIFSLIDVLTLQIQYIHICNIILISPKHLHVTWQPFLHNCRLSEMWFEPSYAWNVIRDVSFQLDCAIPKHIYGSCHIQSEYLAHLCQIAEPQSKTLLLCLCER